MIPTSLLCTQLAIHQFNGAPTLQNLHHLRRALEYSLFVLPTPIVPPVSPAPSPPPTPPPPVVPTERTKTKHFGGDWRKHKNELDHLYEKLIRSCMSIDALATRIETSDHVFTEVVTGRVLFPLFVYFKDTLGSFDDAYRHVVEPIFFYFARHEGMPYDANEAFLSVPANKRISPKDSVYIISVLEQYDPQKFRSSALRGTVQFMFDPVRTRSERNLCTDLYVERFVAVRERVFPQHKLPDVVNGVIEHVLSFDASV